MNGFSFSENQGHAVVRFLTELLDMSWADVEKEAAEIVKQIKSTETSRLIIDLTPMHLIQSGLVASLVRMWKATDGFHDRKVVVTTDNDVVKEVIRSAGLLKLFTVVSTMEEANSEIGVSTLQEVQHRQKRVVAWTAFPLALFSCVALYPIFYVDNDNIRQTAISTGMLAAGVACVAAVFSMITDDGYRRGFGILSMIIGLTVLGTLNAQRVAAPRGQEEQTAPEEDEEESAATSVAQPPQQALAEALILLTPRLHKTR